MMASQATPESGAATAPIYSVKVIGFGRRLAAGLIDGLIVVFMTFILLILVAILGIFSASFNYEDPNTFVPLLIVGGLLISAVYYTGFWQSEGQTFGKQMLGIRVIRAKGGTLGWGKAFLRYIGYIISAVAASLGFLWIVFDGRRQGWHDKIAGTLVVDADDDFAEDEQVTLQPSDDSGRRWLWVVLWVILAVAAPGALFAGAWLLGPILNRLISQLLGIS